MMSDGTKSGFDISQPKLVNEISPVPVIASGGAGCMSDFKNLLEYLHQLGSSCSVFHRNEVKLESLKLYLKMSKLGPI